MKLRIRELAKARGWTLKEVASRAEIPYTTVTTYARSNGMAMADISAVLKLALGRILVLHYLAHYLAKLLQ